MAQIYENFTGAVVMSMVEHGFCAPDQVSEFFTVENLTWPDGGLPINTSGGNLAECYMHGLELVLEAVRQIRGTSTCQVDGRRAVAGGGRSGELAGVEPDPAARERNLPAERPARSRAGSRGRGRRVLGGRAPPSARRSTLPRLRNVPGARRVGVPSLPLARLGLGAEVGTRACLQLDPRSSRGAPGAARGAAVSGRAGRARLDADGVRLSATCSALPTRRSRSATPSRRCSRTTRGYTLVQWRQALPSRYATT